MILEFGDYIGNDLNSPKIPDSYICFLAKPIYKTQQEQRVPVEVKTAVRAEAERRGWTLKGKTWEKDGQVISTQAFSAFDCQKPEKIMPDNMPKKKVCRNCGREGRIIGDGLDSGCYWSVKGMTKGTPEYEVALAKAKKKVTDPSYAPHGGSKKRTATEVKAKEYISNITSNDVQKPEAIPRQISEITALDMLNAELVLCEERVAKLRQAIEILL